MDHPCYKCGANVEDGTAFCPHCNAPQIRVGIEVAALPADLPGSYARLPALSHPNAIEWSQALPSAAIAGLVAAILMVLPFGAFGLGMLFSGILAVLLYVRRVPGVTPTPGMGAKLGAISGAIGFAIFAIFTAIEALVFHAGGELRTALLQAIQQSAARSSDPQAREMIEYLKTPPGLALVMAIGLVVTLIAFLVFSSVGGAIGAMLSKRRDRL